MTLPAHLQFLLDPRAYPHPVRRISLLETHISWVVLTGELAYKIKRPVRLPFVDLTSLERREFLCQEEVRLNRRFAEELYLGVCRITADKTGAMIDGVGPVVDHAVKMRQFDLEEQLGRLVDAHRIQPSELEEFGVALAKIHSGLPCAAAEGPWARPQAVRDIVLGNLTESINVAQGLLDAGPLHALQVPLERRLVDAATWMYERRRRGRVRECHGDLHCDNIVRRGAHLVPFDCLEFEAAFRWIDVADEIAFLISDLQARRRPAHEHAFLAGYLAHSGDYDACRFLNLYVAHRLLVRAKVIALTATHSNDAHALHEAREGIRARAECAQVALSPRRPMLILMSGLSGSGKSWIARQLAMPFNAIHIRSDIERKRMAGLDAAARSQSAVGQGLYSVGANTLLRQHLAVAAEAALSGGFNTLVDASFIRREDRGALAEVGRRVGAIACLIQCHAPLEILRSRISARQLARTDPSEADVAVLEWQRSRSEPLTAAEAFTVLDAPSGVPDLIPRLKRQLQQLQS